MQGRPLPHSLTHSSPDALGAERIKNIAMSPPSGLWLLETRTPLASHFPWSTGGPSLHNCGPICPAWLTGLLCIHRCRETEKQRGSRGGGGGGFRIQHLGAIKPKKPQILRFQSPTALSSAQAPNPPILPFLSICLPPSPLLPPPPLPLLL